MAATPNITGRTFGRLTVIERASVKTNGARWRCRCACGAVCEVRGSNLRNGNTKSCGCLRRERDARGRK